MDSPVAGGGKREWGDGPPKLLPEKRKKKRGCKVSNWANLRKKKEM